MVAAVAVALWIFPAVVFPAPAANDAMVLANLTLPVVAIELLGGTGLAAAGAARQRNGGGAVAMGTFFAGVAVAFGIALVAVGNMSDDRFMPLLFLPVPFVVFGIAIFAIGFARGGAGELVFGVTAGAVAAALLLGWLLIRGSRDWLLAPYGFDVFMLIALEAGLSYWLGSRRMRLHRQEPA
jgi:hypothetical protein